MTQPDNVLRASEHYQAWLTALKERALLATHNQSQAMFREVLQALRRHMTTEQVLNFADALPPLPRGIFIEGWRPGVAQPLASATDLTREVMTGLTPHHVPPESIVSDVMAVLAAHTDAHAAATLRAQLPEAVKGLWT
jgi:uncharacterized protein (DUF2267 family)